MKRSLPRPSGCSQHSRDLQACFSPSDSAPFPAVHGGSGPPQSRPPGFTAFSLLRTCQLGAGHPNPRTSSLLPSLPIIVRSMRRLWFFPPSGRSPPVAAASPVAIMRTERLPFCVRAALSVLRSSRALEHRTTTPLLRGLPRSFSVSSLLRVGPIRARFPSG
ncbi:hypothetical protein NDU88_003842 [Pleurodeles waltl]|uniref:Uncharacterized protein n=1 Tax=Pleurodeles waltl TaxID=8319 RepID=A0AAV7KZL8_PLEWA|nr:hypothetical protein NDU88_003842 [Pleurodeles waltl]